MHVRHTMGGAALLDRLPAVEAVDADEVIEIVRGRFSSHRLTPTLAGLRLSMRTAVLDDMRLHVMNYGGPVIVDADPLETRYLLCLPLAGTATVRANGVRRTSTAGTPILLPVDGEFRLEWPDGTPQIVLDMPRPRFDELVSVMYGPDASILGDMPLIDLSTSRGRALQSELDALCEELNSGAAQAYPQFMRRNLAETVMARVISAIVGDRQSAGATVSNRGHTRVVRGFLGLVESMPDLTPVQAAELLRVPLRTLQQHVRDELGSTPSREIEDARLDRVRGRLLEADPAVSTVTEIAVDAGFGHLGRFSVQYRRRFGEKPSETFRR